MTLVVGIKCRDGAVIAADSTATLETCSSIEPQQTVRTDSVTKLELFEPDLAFGFTGPVGLHQEYSECLTKYMASKGHCHFKDTTKAKEILIERLWPVFKPRMDRLNTLRNIDLRRHFQSECSHAILVSFPTKRSGVELLQISWQCNGEYASKEISCMAVGSGQPQADPFLSFFRRLLFNDELPSVYLATLVAIWVLDITIQHHPGGVGGRINVISLHNVDGRTNVHAHEKMEIQETMQIISEREKQLGKGILQLAPVDERAIDDKIPLE